MIGNVQHARHTTLQVEPHASNAIQQTRVAKVEMEKDREREKERGPDRDSGTLRDEGCQLLLLVVAAQLNL